jgi:hypothetical protein
VVQRFGVYIGYNALGLLGYINRNRTTVRAWVYSKPELSLFKIEKKKKKEKRNKYITTWNAAFQIFDQTC